MASQDITTHIYKDAIRYPVSEKRALRLRGTALKARGGSAELQGQAECGVLRLA